MHTTTPMEGVSDKVETVLNELVAAASQSMGPNLKSVILFGSAAEGRLRATSDVNLMFVLREFKAAEVDKVRDALRVAHAAVKVSAMFVLEKELAAAAEAFAVKFSDMARRHRVLHGDSVLTGLNISVEARKRHLEQILLNTSMRLRERYMLVSLREEQLALVIADAVGPLRVAASLLLDIQGRNAEQPKQALETVAATLGGPDWTLFFRELSQARETRALPPGRASLVLFAMLDLADRMRNQLETMK